MLIENVLILPKSIATSKTCANVDWNIDFVLWTWHLVTNHYQRLGSRKDLGEWNINLKSRPFGKIALTSRLLGVNSTKFIQCWTGKPLQWLICYDMIWLPSWQILFHQGCQHGKTSLKGGNSSPQPSHHFRQRRGSRDVHMCAMVILSCLGILQSMGNVYQLCTSWLEVISQVNMLHK